jgi:transcriptional antiterminator NusG
MPNLYIVRTAIGREDQVMDFLASNAKRFGGVYAIVYPQGMSGYILVEADSDTAVKQVAYKVPYVRGVLGKPTTYEEIDHLIEFKPEQVDVKVGDTVSIIAGPFKGEKAKVTRINLQKSEVILELLEAAVPIPITINLDSIKVVDRKEAEEDRKE